MNRAFYYSHSARPLLQVRTFVLLGSIAGNGDERFRFALLAASYVELLWAKTLYAVNALAAERMYFSMTDAERRNVDDTTGYDAWVESQVRVCRHVRDGRLLLYSGLGLPAPHLCMPRTFVQVALGPHQLPQSTAEWVVYWCSVSSALPSPEELKGHPGNLPVGLVLAAAPPVAVVQQGGIPPSSASKNLRGGAAVAAKASGAEPIVPQIGVVAAKAGLDRPLSSGGAKGGAAAATQPVLVSGEQAPIIGSDFNSEAAAFCRLRCAAAAVRGIHAPFVVSRVSLRRPLLTIQALQWLVRYLCEAGASTRAPPVLALWYCIASDFLGQACMPAVAVSMAATAEWIDGGGCNVAAATAWSGVLALINASEEIERGRYDAELAVAEMQATAPPEKIVEKVGDTALAGISRASRLQEAAQAFGSFCAIRGIRSLARRNIASSTSGTAPVSVPVRTLWLQLATSLVRVGALSAVKRLVLDVRRHAEGFKDTITLWRCHIVECAVLTVEGAFESVIVQATALLTPNNDIIDDEATPTDWFEIVTLLASALLATNNHGDAVSLLTSAVRAFHEAARPTVISLAVDPASAIVEPTQSEPGVGVDLDSAAACVRCRLFLANIIIEWASARKLNAASVAPDANVSSGIEAAWVASESELMSASDLCRQCGLPAALLVDVLTTQVWSPVSLLVFLVPILTNLTLDFFFLQARLASARWGPRSSEAAKAASENLSTAAVICGSWVLALEPHAGPPGWTSISTLASARVFAARAVAESTAAHVESMAATVREAELLADASVDPVSLYLYRTSNNRVGNNIAVQLRVAAARGSAVDSFGLTAERAGCVRAAALAAVGTALLAELRSVVTDAFSDAEVAADSSKKHAKTGLEALERVLWALPRLRPKLAPSVPSGAAVLMPIDESMSAGKGGRVRSSALTAGRDRSASIAVGGAVGAGGAAATTPAARPNALKGPPAGAVPVPPALVPATAPSVVAGTVVSRRVGAVSLAVPGGGLSLGAPMLSSDFMPLVAEKRFDALTGDPWLRSLHASTSIPPSCLPNPASVLGEVPEVKPEAYVAATVLRARAEAVLSRALAESSAVQDWKTAQQAAGDLIECLGSLASASPVQVCQV
jgi:hypothetical protein